MVAARSRNKKRRVGEDMVCPVCSERMTCTAEELTLHVELCLKKVGALSVIVVVAIFWFCCCYCLSVFSFLHLFS